MIPSRLQRLLPVRVFMKFQEDQGPNQAVLIAWNALSAMFPILIFAASILGIVLSRAGFRAQEFYVDMTVLVPDPRAQTQILQGLEGVRSRSGLFFVVGLLGLLWTGSNLFGTMEQTFALVYHTRGRGFLQQKLLAVGMMFLFTVMGGLTVAASGLLPLVERLPYVPTFLEAGWPATVLQIGVGLGAAFVLFTAIYYIVPNRRQKLRQAWVGGAVAAVAFELLTLIFPLYLSLNRGMNQYGSFFALLFVLLFFFWCLGLITVLGLEVNSVLYPVPVEQPERIVTLAPPGSGPEGDPSVAKPASPAAPPERPQRRGIWTVLGAMLLATVLRLVADRRLRAQR